MTAPDMELILKYLSQATEEVWDDRDFLVMSKGAWINPDA